MTHVKIEFGKMQWNTLSKSELQKLRGGDTGGKSGGPSLPPPLD